MCHATVEEYDHFVELASPTITIAQTPEEIARRKTFIAFTAMKYDIPLWTRDSHFKFVQGYYPELKLYED